MRRPAWRLLATSLCVALLASRAALAQDRATSSATSATIAGFAISDCAALTVDPASLAVLLRLELASSLATPIELVTGTPSDARHQITIDCSERPDDLVLRLERTAPPGEYRTVVALHEEPRALRPRTLAIAVAENLRFVEAPIAITPPPTSPPSPKSTALVTTPPRLAPRVQRFRDMSLGFGVPTATLVTVSSILLGVGVNQPPPNGSGQLVPWGGTMLGFAVVGVIGTGISLGIYAKERRKAAAAAPAAATP